MTEYEKKISDLEAAGITWERIAGIWLYDQDAIHFKQYRERLGLTRAAAVRALAKIGLDVELNRNESASEVGEQYERDRGETRELNLAV